MKQKFFYLFVLLCFFACQQKIVQVHMHHLEETDKSKTTAFDAKLANDLGADVYGMKKYVMAFLKKVLIEI